MDDIYKTEAQLLLEERERVEQRQYDSDLADIVQSTSGYRFLRTLLKRLGADRRPSEDVRDVALKNVAYDLIEDIARVSPTQCMNLMASLHQIYK